MAKRDKLGRYNPGRPKLKIDAQQVEQLAAINCTLEEMAAVLRCSVDTLGRRFAETIKEGRAKGKTSLKRKMFDAAVNRNNTAMMIWLSKQMLGYTDRVEETQNLNVTVKPATLNQLEEAKKEDPFIEVEHRRIDDEEQKA